MTLAAVLMMTILCIPRLAHAGVIDIVAKSLDLRSGALIAASTSGDGKGGTVHIDSDSMRMEDKAEIQTQTSGSGDAGAIEIRAKSVDLRSAAHIDAPATRHAVPKAISYACWFFQNGAGGSATTTQAMNEAKASPAKPAQITRRARE